MQETNVIDEKTIVQELLQQAKKDRVELTIELPEKVYLGEINFGGVNPADQKILSISIRHLIKFLGKPLIYDDFSDHEERRAWRRKFPEEWKEFFNSNRLKKNQLTLALYTLENLSKYLREYPQFVKSARTAEKIAGSIRDLIPRREEEVEEMEKGVISEEMDELYDRYSLEEKVAFSKSLHQAIRVLLEQLAES